MSYTTPVYIILLNYRGAEDTISCVNTLLNQTYQHFSIIIVDNSPGDEQVKILQDRISLSSDIDLFYEEEFSNQPKVEKKVTLIKASHNNGFSHGNNLALKFLKSKKQEDFFVWLLNNDTTVPVETLEKMVAYYADSANPKKGILGLTLNFFHNSSQMQCFGGYTYYKMLGLVKPVLQHKIFKNTFFKIDYISGASMFFSSDYLQAAGLLPEGYFIYMEEPDFCLVGNRLGYQHFVMPDAYILHKEGASIGGGERVGKTGVSALSDYYGVRNRIIYTQKNCAYFLPFIYATVFIAYLNRLRRGQYALAKNVLTIMKNPGRYYGHS